jgi:hypothetical protein
VLLAAKVAVHLHDRAGLQRVEARQLGGKLDEFRHRAAGECELLQGSIPRHRPLSRQHVSRIRPSRACPVRALRTQGTSLLAVGVTAVKGAFDRGEVVACLDPDGREVARGLVNYDAQEAERIKGQPSSRFEAILGYLNDAELIHRDNLVLV